MRSLTPAVPAVFAIAALVATSVSCGDVIRNGRSPSILVIQSLGGAQGNHPSQVSSVLSSDVQVLLTTPAPCSTTSPCPTVFDDIGSATFAVVLKDTTVTPTSNNSVTLTRYRVDYSRTDGRNNPGVDVPYGFEYPLTLTIQAGSTGTATFELVRTTAKEESPLVQLVNNGVIINTIATVTFYGTDLVGNAITASGSILINFGNFADQ